MQKLISLFGIVIITLVLACSKEACEKNNTGTIDVSNTKNSTYEIFIDNQKKSDLPPNTSLKFIVTAGNEHSVYAEQKKTIS